MYLLEQHAGAYYTLDSDTSFTTAANTWSTYRAVGDGAHIEVWRNEDGQMPVKVLESNSSQVLTTNYVGIATTAGSASDFDDVRIVSDSLSNATTFTVNNANELVTMVDPNGTTNFVFDDWGRMASKSRSSYTATYAYRYDSKFESKLSSFPDEGQLSVGISGDQVLRQYVKDSDTLQLEPDINGVPMAEYSENHNSFKSLFNNLESGSTSAVMTPPAVYNLHDVTGSVRMTINGAKNVVAATEYEPFGSNYCSYGTTAGVYGYASLIDLSDPELLLTQNRCYSPKTGRWLSQDPMGVLVSTNAYNYTGQNPVNAVDPSGLSFLDCLGNDLGGYGPAGGNLGSSGYEWPDEWNWPRAGYTLPLMPIPKIPKRLNVPKFLEPLQRRGLTTKFTSIPRALGNYGVPGMRAVSNFIKRPIRAMGGIVRINQAAIIVEGGIQITRIGISSYRCW